MQNKMMSAITAASVASALYVYNTPPSLEESVKTISEFSQKVAKEAKDHPLSKEQKAEIGKLANLPVMIPKLVKENAVLSAGVRFMDANDKGEIKPVVLNALSGEELKTCGTIGMRDTDGSDTQSGNDAAGECLKIVELDEKVRAAFGINSAVNGKVKVKGETKDAIFVVSVNMFYKGSQCITYYIGGRGYQFCYG